MYLPKTLYIYNIIVNVFLIHYRAVLLRDLHNNCANTCSQTDLRNYCANTCSRTDLLNYCFITCSGNKSFTLILIK